MKFQLVKHLTSYVILLDKLDGFHFSGSVADILTVITEFVYQNLDKNCEIRAVVLDNSERLAEFGMLSLFTNPRVTASLVEYWT